MTDETPLQIIRPDPRIRERGPWWAMVLLIVGTGVSLLSQALGPLGVLYVIGLSAVGFSACALASWFETLSFLWLARRRTGLRVFASATLPLSAFVLAPMLAATSTALLTPLLLGDAAAVAIVFGSLWFVGASLGSMTVIIIDVAVSAVVARFRTRIILATLLLMVGALGMAGLFALLVQSGLSLLSAVNVDELTITADTEEARGVVLELIEFMRDEPIDSFAFFLGLGALVALPAVLSACGKLADAVMERIHPLVHALDAVAAGARDVHLEEAGSYDFIEVSRHFNRMVDTLRLGERMERAFGTYISPQVLTRIRAQSGAAILPASTREASVFFSDVRGFTRISEGLAPAVVVEVLNRYLSRVVEIVNANEGYLDKFIGDAVVVVFNGPIDQADHATRAVKCAAALVREAREMSAAGLFPEVGALEVGVGLASGPMLAGNIGGAGKTEYTVIGDTVNTASRIEGMTKVYGASMLVNARAVELVGAEMRFRRLDRVAAKGRAGALEIFECLDALDDASAEARVASLERFVHAQGLLWAKDLAAVHELDELAGENPDDAAIALWRLRAHEFEREGFPPGYDGVSRLHHK